MEALPSRQRRIFPAPLLMALLAVSIATNVILGIRLHYPGLWESFRSALIPAPAVTPQDHIRGLPGAEVTVIEYSDFLCPFSAEFHSSMAMLLREKRVRWVYRHFPLENIHPLAPLAAQASECAGEQDLFWEYADELFINQQELSEEALLEIAWSIPLDLTAFESCLESGRHRAAVSSHRDDDVLKSISGTPTFFVDGRRFQGAFSYAQLSALVTESAGGEREPAGICR